MLNAIALTILTTGMGADLVLDADTRLSGVHHLSSLRVPEGVTLTAHDELEVHCSGPIVIEGTVEGRREASSLRRDGVSLSLSSETAVVVRGAVRAGHGLDGPVEGDVQLRGGDGGTVFVEAPRVHLAGDVHAGDGGDGGFGQDGGNGGDALVRSPFYFWDGTETGTTRGGFGGDGGDGRDGLLSGSGEHGGDGGDAGDTFAETLRTSWRSAPTLLAAALDSRGEAAYLASALAVPAVRDGCNGTPGTLGTNALDATAIETATPLPAGPCTDGAESPILFPISFFLPPDGGNGGDGGAATCPGGIGGVGGTGGDGGDTFAPDGQRGQDGGDCCGPHPEKGGDGGDGAPGSPARGGKGGKGGDGGPGWTTSMPYGHGGNAGAGGNGGAAVGGDGGDGGNGGDGDPGGAAGDAGAGGLSIGGAAGKAGDPARGGAVVDDGIPGPSLPTDPGTAGMPGGRCRT